MVINLSAVMLKIKKRTNPCVLVYIFAESTTFFKSKLFRNKLDYYIKTYLNEENSLLPVC